MASGGINAVIVAVASISGGSLGSASSVVGCVSGGVPCGSKAGLTDGALSMVGAGVVGQVSSTGAVVADSTSEALVRGSSASLSWISSGGSGGCGVAVDVGVVDWVGHSPVAGSLGTRLESVLVNSGCGVNDFVSADTTWESAAAH